VRQPDGSLRASLNVCRHRGARLANGGGRGLRNLVCPYHAWCYGTDGKLLARPDERSFAEIDKSARGLRELAVAEKYGMKYGMIWVSPTTEEVSVLDNLLNGRVILGIGRGLGRIEFNGFRAAMSESRARFIEYA